MTDERYLFLGGHRKCGTTMLLNLFDGHEKCCVYPTDITVLYGYFPHFTQEKYTIKERIERLDRIIFGTLSKLLNKQESRSDRLPLEVMRAHFLDQLDSNRLTQIGYIIRQLVASFRQATRQPIEEFPVVVLKETSLEIYAQELGALFKGSRFIELIRDPRDNYAALLAGANKHYNLFGENEKHLLSSLLHRVGLSMHLSQCNHDMLGEDRFLSIRFEDLTGDPAAEIKKITNWASISSSACFDNPTVLGTTSQGNNYDGEKFAKVTTRNVGRWTERINPFEAQVIEFHLGEIMAKFGYNCIYDRETTAIAAAEFYKWSNYHFFFKDSFQLF